MDHQNTPDHQTQTKSISNQQLTNSDLRQVSLHLDSVERNSILARVDDQTQSFTAALINPGTSVAETGGSGTFSNSEIKDDESHLNQKSKKE